MRKGWKVLRGELLPKWIAEHPGTRPYAWWVFDAPERRRRIGTMHPRCPGKDRHTLSESDYELVEDGKSHPFANPERTAKVDNWRRQYPDVAGRDAYSLHRGVPACLLVRDDFYARYESEAAYLHRLGLLTESERAIFTT